MSRIKNLFKVQSKKVIPYITAGYPSKDLTVDLVLAAEKSGAAMIELGMPFSDPLADGPIIQESSQVAIKNNVDIGWILDTVSQIRLQSEIPLVLMGYINPIIKYGMNNFICDCSKVGVDGLIIPDLPPEESIEYISVAKKYNVSPILLIAPNSTNERIAYISGLAQDLVYCVSILGITGSNVSSNERLELYMQRVKNHSKCPYVIGFGIKNKNDVRNINLISDGAVIGTALIEKLGHSNDPVASIAKFIKELLD